MWAEVSPDGKQIWTSSGDDLLAYNAADVSPANAQPAGRVIKPVRRLAGAVPAHGHHRRGVHRPAACSSPARTATSFQVTSIDLTTGAGGTEIEETINGESEGLDDLDGARRHAALDGHAVPAGRRPADLRARQGHAAPLQARSADRARADRHAAHARRWASRTRFTLPGDRRQRATPVRRGDRHLRARRARARIARGSRAITRTLARDRAATPPGRRSGASRRARSVVRSSR